MGGDLVGCDNCVSSYCESCIDRNLGHQHLAKVKENVDWSCYSCDPSATLSLRWENTKAASVRARVSHADVNTPVMRLLTFGLLWQVGKKKAKGRTTKKSKARSAKAEAVPAPKADPEKAVAEEPALVAPAAVEENTTPASSEHFGKITGESSSPESSFPNLDAAQVKKMKVAQLRAELSARALSTKGKKDCLVERLLESIASDQEPAQPASDQQASTDAGDDTADAEPAQPASDQQASTDASDDIVSAAPTARSTTPEPADSAAVASPRRLHSTPKRPAPEKQEQQPAEDSPIELMSIGTQDTIAMDGRPSGLISPSQIGQAIQVHKSEPTTHQCAGRKRNLDALESELNAEVDSRCQLMLNNARAHGDALRTKFKTQLARLTKKNRTMTLREFAEAYGVGLEAQIMSDIRQRLAAEGWSEPQKNDIGAPCLLALSYFGATQLRYTYLRKSAWRAGNDMEIAPTPMTSQKAHAAMLPPQSIPAPVSYHKHVLAIMRHGLSKAIVCGA